MFKEHCFLRSADFGPSVRPEGIVPDRANFNLS
jgi:hypothetical protein